VLLPSMWHAMTYHAVYWMGAFIKRQMG